MIKALFVKDRISTDSLRWFLRRISGEKFLTNLLRVYWECKQLDMKNYDTDIYFKPGFLKNKAL